MPISNLFLHPHIQYSKLMVTFDEFGPEKILEVWDPKTGMHGFVVLDNLARGPGKGGIRFTPTVSVGEVSRLARAMTWKNSLAGLPFGGAKAGIVGDDRKISKEEKKKIIQSFSMAIKAICPKLYVAGPDMNTSEEEMKWFAEANGSWKSCTGKPADMCVEHSKGKKCGIPHEYGSTGFGIFQASLIGAKYAKLDLKNSTVAIEGFGNVGWFAAKYLSEYGAKVVAVSDSKGAVYKNDGLDFKTLDKTKKKEEAVAKYPGGKVLDGKEIIGLNTDILITAAVPDLIKKEDIDKIKVKLIVEGSNIPATPEIEEILHKKGILIVPDFVANAGGVISSYAEYKGKNPDQMFKLVEKKIKSNTEQVLKRSTEKGVKPRDAAIEIAVERVRRAMRRKAG